MLRLRSLRTKLSSYRYRVSAAGESDKVGAADIDPRIFFSVLFGGEKFHSFTGDLALAHEAETIMNAAKSEAAEKESFEKQRRAKLKREILCSVHVIDKLKLFVEKRQEGEFVKATIAEALELVKENFGAELLETIGFAYENHAKQ